MLLKNLFLNFNIAIDSIELCPIHFLQVTTIWIDSIELCYIHFLKVINNLKKTSHRHVRSEKQK